MEKTNTFLGIRDSVQILSKFGYVEITFGDGNKLKVSKENYDGFLLSNPHLHNKKTIVIYNTDNIKMEII